MNIVRENINFERGQDPKKALGIGSRERIHKWFESFPYTISPDDYTINDDMSIDIRIHMSLILEKQLFPGGRLPSYIRFRKSIDEVDVDDCGLISLEGFPQEIDNYFSCQNNNLDSLDEGPKKITGAYYCNGNPGKFTEDYVKSICNVVGRIQAEDTEEW